ncbi:MAG: polysaccharide deacetylase family protein [Chthoniobacterales bacterium]
MKALLRETSLIVTLIFLAACQAVHTQNPTPDETPRVTSGVQERSFSTPYSMDGNTSIHNTQPISQTPSLEDPLKIPSTPTPTPVVKKSVSPRLVYNSIPTSEPVVALTFDDGPHPKLTPKLLDLLKKENIKATFYVVGQMVDAHPEVLRRTVQEGHEIGNHSWSHPAFTKLSSNGVKSQVDRTNQAIKKAAGVTPTNIRPPYGATNKRLNKRLNEEFGLKVIMWSVDPQDWKYRNSTRVANQILTNAKPGDIILAHDIHATTIAAMPRVISELKKRGYRFVTVSELIAMEGAPASAPAPTPAVQSSLSTPPPESNITPGTIQSQRPTNEF